MDVLLDDEYPDENEDDGDAGGGGDDEDEEEEEDKIELDKLSLLIVLA